MTSKVIEGHKSSSNFSVNPTLPNTFVYVLVLMEIYMNGNFMYTQILHLYKYDLKTKCIEVHKSSSNFSVNPTLPNTFIYE